MSEPRSD